MAMQILTVTQYGISGGRGLQYATNRGFLDKIKLKFACFYHTVV